ncbi:phage tail protein [Hafnia alvei FB1]|uniref:Phage tail protein n=1 Tax=Hafnia alvei FB1 TaxID=1453496 RepID=A0A097R5S7_HAFAL|nr:phage tail protein [Hafnia alvei]AIU74082.1 phage tail protein [Hafnia alvei FB1]TBL59345.1 phage tail protein [Hafnia alvei]
MAAKFFALLTHLGAAKLSNMAALGEKLEITSLAVGDGGGVSPTPNQAQTKLINEVRRAQLNSLSVDKDNDSQIIAEQIIPESAGGWWIREIGLFDAAGDLIAIANCPETYKATTEEGSGRTQVIRMLLTVSSTDAVTLKVDPSVVLATRQYVDDKVIEVKAYSDELMKKHLAEANPHKQYPLIANALKEMADAGLVSKVLENLRLGAGAPPIGIPFFWPSVAMPNTVMDEWSDMVFLKWNGATFSASTYPKLALVIPSLKLTEARGEFIRIWDDGRGIDSGRTLLSAQTDTVQKFTGKFYGRASLALVGGSISDSNFGATGVFSSSRESSAATNALSAPNDYAVTQQQGVTLDSSLQIRTSTETRARNIAFNFLVRAK